MYLTQNNFSTEGVLEYYPQITFIKGILKFPSGKTFTCEDYQAANKKLLSPSNASHYLNAEWKGQWWSKWLLKRIRAALTAQAAFLEDEQDSGQWYWLLRLSQAMEYRPVTNSWEAHLCVFDWWATGERRAMLSAALDYCSSGLIEYIDDSEYWEYFAGIEGFDPFDDNIEAVEKVKQEIKKHITTIAYTMIGGAQLPLL